MRGRVAGDVDAYVRGLPEPFRHERFDPYLDRIYDRDSVRVYLNEAKDFAFLYPPVDFDYEWYDSREKRLGLGRYKKSLELLRRRYAKVSGYLPESGTFAEVGSADGSFLRILHADRPELDLTSIELDESFREQRGELTWLRDLNSFDDVVKSRLRFDSIGFFHTFEHMRDPRAFLSFCRAALRPGGRIVMEIPTLEDPLLSLYELPAYRSFYFQAQHPFVYSSTSLRRLLEHEGWAVAAIDFYQRYGLENHVTWLRKGTPGGDERLAEMFANLDPLYRTTLEQARHADTLIAIAEPSGS